MNDACGIDEGLEGLSWVQECVRDFHRVMIGETVTPREPVRLHEYNGELRCALIEEEAREFRMAWEGRNRLAMIDALCDLIYVVLGAGVQLGVELSPFFAEVHGANMRKAGGRLREDGKQLKPADWTPPDLAGVYRRLHGNLPEGEPPADSAAAFVSRKPGA